MSEAMKTTNEAMNVKETMKVLQEFQRETERMEVKQELMDDALMDAFDNEEVEEEGGNFMHLCLVGRLLERNTGGEAQAQLLTRHVEYF